ncbi:basic proline-rich protein-like [Mastomys coucha]|uniref:basic proline-rich protein-like n=1 Tax=Mastomys coucha TaxID=35658 RepID=UPI0012629411|nr:basic proline-rich protein-like [Mastomys coucha]
MTKPRGGQKPFPQQTDNARQTIVTTEDNTETTRDNATARAPSLPSRATPPHPSTPELPPPRPARPRTSAPELREPPPPTQAARATRACSLGRVASRSRSCNLLRRPREPADPGLVAKSDVVYRIQTEGRRPAASSGSSDSGVRNAPGRQPPRPPLVWAGECPPGPPPSSATLLASLLVWPRAPGNRCGGAGASGWALHPGSPQPLAGQPAAGLDKQPLSGCFHF